MPAELPPDIPKRRSVQGDANGRRTTREHKNAHEAQIAQKLAEDNIRAKQKAVQWADGNASDERATSDEERPERTQGAKSALTKAASSLMKVPQSMFSRMAGRKIKIAGAKRK